MDAEEYTDWEALYTYIEPMPEGRADLRMGITIANVLTPKLKIGAAPLTPSQFMPTFGGVETKRKPGQMSDAELKRQWEKFAKG